MRVVAALCVRHNILNNFDKEEQVAADESAIAALENKSAGDDAEHIYNISTAEVQSAVIKCKVRSSSATQLRRLCGMTIAPEDKEIQNS